MGGGGRGRGAIGGAHFGVHVVGVWPEQAHSRVLVGVVPVMVVPVNLRLVGQRLPPPLHASTHACLGGAEQPHMRLLQCPCMVCLAKGWAFLRQVQ